MTKATLCYYCNNPATLVLRVESISEDVRRSKASCDYHFDRVLREAAELWGVLGQGVGLT